MASRYLHISIQALITGLHAAFPEPPVCRTCSGGADLHVGEESPLLSPLGNGVSPRGCSLQSRAQQGLQNSWVLRSKGSLCNQLQRQHGANTLASTGEGKSQRCSPGWFDGARLCYVVCWARAGTSTRSNINALAQWNGLISPKLSRQTALGLTLGCFRYLSKGGFLFSCCSADGNCPFCMWRCAWVRSLEETVKGEPCRGSWHSVSPDSGAAGCVTSAFYRSFACMLACL